MPPIHIGSRTVIARYIGALAVASVFLGGESVFGGESAPIVARVASTYNRYPLAASSITGGLTALLSRYPVTIGGSPQNLRLVFNNSYLLIAGESPIPNAVYIDEVSIERTATAAQNSAVLATTPVYFGGSRSRTLAAGEVDVVSDAVLPAALGVAEFVKGSFYYLKIKAHVALATDKFPGSRGITDDSSQRAWRYDPAVTVASAADTPGAFTTVSGTAIAAETQVRGLCPIVIGDMPDNAKSFVAIGDSIISEDYSYFKTGVLTAASGPFPLLVLSVSGISQVGFNTGAPPHRAMFKYGAVMLDELGTNGAGTAIATHFPAIWSAARAAGVRKIFKTLLGPKSLSTQTASSITNTGTAATMAISSGTLPPVGKTITVRGATVAAYNGIFTVTRSGSGSVDFTLATNPGASAAIPTGASIYWSDVWTTAANQQVNEQALRTSFNAAMTAYVGNLIDGTIGLDELRASTDSGQVGYWLWKEVYPGYPQESFLNETIIGLHPKSAAHTAAAVGVAALMDSITP